VVGCETIGRPRRALRVPLNVMSRDPDDDQRELLRLRAEVAERERGVRDTHEREQRHADALIARLRLKAHGREDHLADLRERLEAAERELVDLRAIRDALTPPEIPERPGVELAAALLPAAERVSGDFYLVAEGPEDATVLVVGDVVGHGLAAARRAAFTRATFAATASFSDDPCLLLDWANLALIERSSDAFDYVTAACVTFLPRERRLRWAYAGHPPALSLDDPRELPAPQQGAPLGLWPNPGYAEASRQLSASTGMLLYTDGLTDARRGESFLGLDGVLAALGRLRHPSPTQAVNALRTCVAEFATEPLADDLCLLAARFD
jgi:serine phosphatase RsbU (regulator of sigma subunit)